VAADFAARTDATGNPADCRSRHRTANVKVFNAGLKPYLKQEVITTQLKDQFLKKQALRHSLKAGGLFMRLARQRHLRSTFSNTGCMAIPARKQLLGCSLQNGA